MRKYTLLFLSFIVAIIAVQAQDTGPQMTFEKESHEFGDVVQGQKVKYTFIYTNTGTDTLLVRRVVPSCGCTIPEDFSKAVPPGQQGTITVEYNSEKKIGINSESLIVLSNIVSDKPKILYIRVNVLMPKP